MSILCGIIVLLIASTDLYIKNWVEKNMPPKKDKYIFRSKGILRKVHNKGMMMNLADKYPKKVQIISVIVTLFTAITQLYFRGKPGYEKEQIGLAFILGGAISNTFDRIKRGYVVDYIAINTKNKKCSRITYNVGDFAIFTGVFLILIFSCIRKK